MPHPPTSIYCHLLIPSQHNYYIMKTTLGENMLRKERSGEAERARVKISPGQTAAEQPKKVSQETIMMFNFQQYPFPNGQSTDTPLLKTIVNLELSTEKLQKVIKLSHPNIIGLRKIVRSSPKESFQGSKHRSYYSFYYELAHYGLKDLVQDPNKNMRLFNQIRPANLRQVLIRVVEYLKQAGIYYLARLQDIGVHEDGSIKVYVPPHVVFDSHYNPNIHRAILAIAEWWDSSTKFKKDKKVLQLQPPRLSDNGDLELDDPSMKSSTLQRELGELLDDAEESTEQATQQLKQSTNSYCSDVTKLGSMQLQKMKRIGEEVKFIRSRLNNEKTKRKHKESDITHEKQIEKSKPGANLFDSQQMPKKEEHEKVENYYPRQPIQQNIHTINIYNHNPSPPNVFAQIHTKFMQKGKNYQVYYDHNLDPDFFPDQDDQYSQDTYDIEFQNQFEMPNPSTSNNYRHTLFTPPERELSEYSEHCHKKSRQGWGNETKTKSKLQMVQVCNKNVTQSAGPLQFKSFVNKIIKPQFLAKKSNIYEDPQEDGDEESEREADKARKLQQSGRKWEEPMSKRQLNGSIKRHFSTQKSLNDFKKLSNKSVTDFGNEQKHDIKRINSQHDFRVGKGRYAQDSQIEQKVRKALEKTKNAIALLNRVKSCKGNLMASQGN